MWREYIYIKILPRNKKEICFTSASLTVLKPLTVWITTNWKIFNEMGVPDHLNLSPEKPVCRSRSQQLELDMEQLTSSKLGKEYVKVIHCHPVYLTYTQSTSCKMPDCLSHKLK